MFAWGSLLSLFNGNLPSDVIAPRTCVEDPPLGNAILDRWENAVFLGEETLKVR